MDMHSTIYYYTTSPCPHSGNHFLSMDSLYRKQDVEVLSVEGSENLVILLLCIRPPNCENWLCYPFFEYVCVRVYLHCV